jgi:hypothetical protein
VSECVNESSIMRRPWHTVGCCAMVKISSTIAYVIRMTTTLKTTEVTFRVFSYFDHIPIGAEGTEDYTKLSESVNYKIKIHLHF